MDLSKRTNPPSRPGDECVLRMSKVAVGPMTEDKAASVGTFGNLTHFEDGLRAVIEGS
jgi:hypothetical protein